MHTPDMATKITRLRETQAVLVAALREAQDALNGAPNTVGLHNQINAAIDEATKEGL